MPYGSTRFVPDYPIGWRSSDTTRGTRLVRPFLCVGLADTSTPANIQASLLALSGMPKLYDIHPTISYCYCTDHNIIPLNGPNAFIVEVVYASAINSYQNGKGLAGVVWTVNQSTQISWIQAESTANGSDALYMWYQNGQQAATSQPTNPDPFKSFTAPRPIPFRAVKATGNMLGSDYITVAGQYKSQAGCINSAPWGPVLTQGMSQQDPRGYWLFLGDESVTPDFGFSFTVSLNFLYNPNSWYPIGTYKDDLGLHPLDCATYSTMLGLSPPAVNTVVRRNGMALASIMGEFDFNSIFNFGFSP